MLDAVLVCATGDHGQAIAQAVRMIRDQDSAVRWKALHFLAAATRDQLAAATPYVADAGISASLTWLLNHENGRVGREELASRPADPDALVRVFAAVADARLGRWDLLDRAAEFTDPDVSTNAQGPDLGASRQSSRRCGRGWVI